MWLETLIAECVGPNKGSGSETPLVRPVNDKTWIFTTKLCNTLSLSKLYFSEKIYAFGKIFTLTTSREIMQSSF